MTMLRRFVRSEYFLLVALIFASLSLAAMTLTSYGESWDEYNFYLYAKESLSAYTNIGNPNFILFFHDPTLRYYGPWFLMLIVLVSKLLPQLIISDIAHMMTFLFFQAGIVIFYLLARRWFERLPAFGATLLFATQPILWGHAFINARDIPFLVGFLATIYFGLRMIDSLSVADLMKMESQPDSLTPLIRADVATWAFPARIILPLGLLAGLPVFAWWSATLVTRWEAAAIRFADTTSARELDLYLRPLLAQFWGITIFSVLSLVWLCLLFLPIMPRTRAYLWNTELHPVVVHLGHYVRNRDFIIASFFLGLAIATRILGAATGVLIILLLFRKHGRGASLAMFAYVLFSLPVVYVTWPYLWSEPLLRLLITLRVMLKFPWPGMVLFDGALYAGNELPRFYLLKLLFYQLTEPAILLTASAIGIVLWQIYRKQVQAELVLLAALWFGLPVAAAVLGRPYLYDNFRQLLFALPPLFLLSGVALEWLFCKIQKTVVSVAVMVILVLPGVCGAAAVHPYEYIYYNSFAGGVAGAQGRYELDYWGASMRAMAHYVNANLPQGASVVVWGPAAPFWSYARSDLKVYDSRDESHPTSDFYAVILRRARMELEYYPSLAALYVVTVRGVPLATLKYVEP
jgi:hypothetical protein